MSVIKHSELIINPDGSVYHLNLLPGELAQTIITVGDPDRVARISQHFERVEVKKQRREFVTHTGFYRGKRLSVIGTGVGTDNMDIVMNEVDALFNVNFETRTIKDQLTSLQFIRIGTSGSMRQEVEVDSVVCSSHAIGLDGMMHAYNYADPTGLTSAFLDFCEDKVKLSIRPYAAPAKPFIPTSGWQSGITLTCSGFYGPQYRKIRLQPAEPEFLSTIRDFQFNGSQITNIEMESAALFGMSHLLGHAAMSVNAILANRQTGTFSKDTKAPVDRLIIEVLERLV